jgi:hypothetical protein
MLATGTGADLVENRSGDPSAGLGDSIEPRSRSQDEDEGILASRTPADAAKKSTATIRPDGDESIRVTLGRPEPLPALARSTPSTTKLASTRFSSQSKGDQQVSRSDAIEAPARSQTAAGADSSGQGEDPVARRARQPAKDDPESLLSQAEARLETLNTYQAKITRTERVSGRLQPDEEILLSIRRNPKAVRLEWTTGPNKGREVIYSSRLDQGALFVHTANSAIPLPTMRIPVDSPLVMRNSRHSITEAGFDTIIENLRKSTTRNIQDHPELGEHVYQGLATPPGFDRPSYRFTRRSPSGETWTVYLDTHTMLPRMVVATDSNGDLIERYVYRDVRENPTELASADAFDPDRRWGTSSGFLSRLARGPAGSAASGSSQAATR